MTKSSVLTIAYIITELTISRRRALSVAKLSDKALNNKKFNNTIFNRKTSQPTVLQLHCPLEGSHISVLF